MPTLAEIRASAAKAKPGTKQQVTLQDLQARAQQATPPTVSREAQAGIGQTIQRMINVGAPAAGGVFGGSAGALLGAAAGGIGALPGAVAGAGLGAAAGSTIAETARPFLTGEQIPLLQQYERHVREGLIEGIMESGAPVVGRGIRTATVPVGRAIRRRILGDIMPQVNRTREMLKELGAELSLGQITGARGGLIDVLENITENAFTNVRRAGKFFGRQIDAMRSVQEQFIRGLGDLDPTQAGRLLKRVLDDNLAAVRPIRRKLYGMIRASGAPSVQTGEIIDFINSKAGSNPLHEAINRALDNGIESLRTTRPRLPRPGEAGAFPITEHLKSLPKTTIINEMDIATALEARASLNQVFRDLGRDDAVGRAAGNLASQLSTAIKKAADAADPSARRVIDAADAFFVKTQERFANDVVRRLSNKILAEDPAQLARALLQPDKPETIRRVRRAVGSEKFDQIVRPQLFKHVLQRFRQVNPTSPQFGLIDGPQLLTYLRERGEETSAEAFNVGKLQTLRELKKEIPQELFGREGVTALRELAEASAIIESRATGPGRILIQLTQAGAAIQLALAPFGGPLSAGSAAVIVGPDILGRLLTFNPTAIKFLVEGVRENAMPNVARFLRQAAGAVVAQVIEESASETQAAAQPQLSTVGSARRPTASGLARAAEIPSVPAPTGIPLGELRPTDQVIPGVTVWAVKQSIDRIRAERPNISRAQLEDAVKDDLGIDFKLQQSLQQATGKGALESQTGILQQRRAQTANPPTQP